MKKAYVGIAVLSVLLTPPAMAWALVRWVDDGIRKAIDNAWRAKLGDLLDL